MFTNMVDAAGTTKYTYTALGELLTEDGPWASDTVTYGYHASVPRLRTSVSLQQPSGSWTQTYNPDAAKRLASVVSPAGTFTYTYRGAGNLWTKLALPNTGRIPNAYSSIGALTNTTLRTSGGTVTNRHSYVYNMGHQRTRQTRTDASYVDYTYDPIGQLRTAVGTGDQSTENLDGQERTSANTPTVSYARGQDPSGTIEGVGGIGGLLARSDQYSGGTWGRHVFYHADGNGNVTALIDSAQTVVAAYRYNPYGQLLKWSGSLAGANTLRFSSKPWFQSEGLYYYGYRFYDPLTQRWLNRDPIGESGFETLRGGLPNARGDGPNRYLMVRNNPLSYTDAWGLRLTVDDCEAFRRSCLLDIPVIIRGGRVAGATRGACVAGGALAAGKWYGKGAGATVAGVGAVWALFRLGRNMGEAMERQQQCITLYSRCLEVVGAL